MDKFLDKKKLIWASILTGLVALVILGIGVNYIFQIPASESEDITLAITPHPASELIFVAQENDFFEEEGVNVKFVQFQTGKLALDALLGGGADMAITADVPITLAAMSKQKFKVISTIGWSQNDIQVVARKDANIYSPLDLKGKRIGTTAGNGPHYFTYAFLKTTGLDIADVQLTFLLPSGMLPAMKNNEFDAIIIYDPYLSTIQQQLGNNATVFAPKDVYGETWNLVGSPGLIENFPQKISKFMRALKKAEAYKKAHPEETPKIVAKYAGIDSNTVSQVLKDWTIEISPEPNLGKYLSKESEWASSTGISKSPILYDFNEWISSSFLN